MNDSTDLFFSPDFAARVLGEAERVAARRLRRRRLAGLAATAAASVAIALWVFAPMGRPDTRSADVPRLAAAQIQVSGSRTDNPDALGYLFPDAEPVARFATQYSDANDAGDDLDLLGDEDAGTP